MGRIVTSVTLVNVKDPSQSMRCDALVDTGAAHMVLPSAWRDRLGDLELIDHVQVETGDQRVIDGELRGPVQLQLEGFRRLHTDVLFLDMQPEDGVYEPLVGYIVLEQAQAAVDMVGHRLIHVRHVDLK